MFLADLELFLVELPAGDGALRTLLVRVSDDQGREGWGETRPIWQAGELAERRNLLLAVLAGRPIHDIEALLVEELLAEPAVACGIEMALWDLIARAAGQPLYNLLGGAYRQNIPVAIRLWPGGTDAVVHWARTFATQGIAIQTISSTGAIDTDVQLVTALGEIGTHRVQFRLDGRGLFEPDRAARLCAELDPQLVDFLLDPVPRGRLAALGLVRRQSRVPLAASATLCGPADVFELARAPAVSTVLIDPRDVGGLLRARNCAVVAEAGGLTTGLRMLGASGLGLAASLQLAASTPALSGGHENSYPQLHDDVLVEPLLMSGGMFTLPAGPGIGAQVDRDKVDWYQVR